MTMVTSQPAFNRKLQTFSARHSCAWWILCVGAWLAIGARIGNGLDFRTDVQPILEQHCLACHSGDHLDGDYDLSTRNSALTSGANAPSLIPGKPAASALFTTTEAAIDDERLMPPVDAGGPLSKGQIDTLRAWILAGADWPEGAVLTPKARLWSHVSTPDDLELVRKIRTLIVETSGQRQPDPMTDYTGKIQQTGITYRMTAIPGGRFLMGSPATEAHREISEGPQAEVALDPFWIGKYEVTWDEYEPYMITKFDREKHGARKDFDPAKHTMVDAVSGPTAPYMEMSFGMGQSGYPAISMTQHAASKYCQWLSAQTGHFYRLPTEAEWEYACRAGTTTAYSFGDDASQLDQYAWYYENSNEKYQQVGTKQPNPWGLHDMHGNVREWTTDRFTVEYFTEISADRTNPYLRPANLYPRSVRGGGWDDDAEQLRSAHRRGSDRNWKQQDPQLPKSIWYHTDAQWLGFRIVRPKILPSAEEMYFYWNSAAGKVK
ncbi:MAG: SUMF1/EgtB/PvdO family nonheme iron enzyme [Bythopirellula sp.]